jgi:glycosyltransferase involved in cell wall biosynthesis
VHISLLGHFGKAMGLATAARGTAAALRAAGVTVQEVDLDALVAGAAPAPADATALTIFHTNPDQLARALAGPHAQHLMAFADRRYTIGFWAWEAEGSLPPAASAVLPLLNELWVPSRFTASILAPAVPQPVLDMGHVVAPPAPALSRDRLGLPPDGCLFLTVFDALSNISRKNPMGSIAAFQAAFPPGRAGVRLILKGRHLSPALRQEIAAAAGGHRSILLAEGDLPEQEMVSLVAACDVFLSLHRAEGFGLVIAEAMALGRPAVVTGYSGNMDFTTPFNSLLVRHRPQTLSQDDGYYPAGSRWADPDIGHAARLMRLLAGSPRRRQALGAQAAEDVRAAYSSAAVGRRMAERLATIAAHWTPPPARRLTGSRAGSPGRAHPSR